MEYASDLTWSPDGRWATYRLREILDHSTHIDIGGDCWHDSLCVIRADGTGARRLYSKDMDVEIAGWSTDEQRVLFWTLIHTHHGSFNVNGSPLYDVGVQGGKLRLLTIPFRSRDGHMENHMMREPENVAFSPDGKSLLLVCGGGRFSPLSNKRLCLLDYSSGKRRWMSGEDKVVREMAWSPDGMHFVFPACPDWSPFIGEKYTAKEDTHWRERDTDWRESHTHLWIIDAHGRHLRRLTSDARYMEEDAKWLSDNKIIRFTRVDNRAASIGKRSHWEIKADETGLRCIDIMTADTETSTRTATPH